MEALHQSNIITHVLTGSIALLLGLVALLTIKGGKVHNKSGRYFLMLISVVIFTGLMGVFVFGRNTFLLVITILSGYLAFSGFRILKLKANVPKVVDIAMAIISLVVLAYFLYYFKSIGMIWSPIIIYSTVGALVLIVVYDLVRYFIPKKHYQRKRVWLYEHIYKMTNAFGALLAAFSGTVLDAYQPHSQYLPSVLIIITCVGFMVYVSKYELKIITKERA